MLDKYDEQADKRAKLRIVRYLPPPVELLPADNFKGADLSFYGRTTYSNYMQDKRFIFAIKDKDRSQHSYVLGKSGVGKSKFMESIARQDIQRGKALVMIDPHGDLIDDILRFLPKKRHDDLCLIDPSDETNSIAFNPLSNVDENLKNRVAQDLIEVLKKNFDESWTPKIEHVFRFTLLALLDYPEANFSHIIDMLTDKNFRQKVIKEIKNDFVKRFWAVEFSAWSQKFESEAITPLVNKIGAFLSNPLINKIFTHSENKIDLYDLMNENKIILINLSKGKLGEENSSFFGAIFLTKIKQAGMQRAFLPADKRNQVFIYIDEFQNIVTDTFESLLSESRKYGFAITLSHQYLDQLPLKIKSAVLGNVSTIISFRISGNDATEFIKEFNPLLEEKDLMNLAKREYYIKTIIDGEAYNPFSAQTLFVNDENSSDENAKLARATSYEKYSQSADTKQSAKKSVESVESGNNDEDIEPII